MTRQVRCGGCRGWFDARKPDCPACQRERPKHNKWLRTAALNNNLNTMANQSLAEDAALKRS